MGSGWPVGEYADGRDLAIPGLPGRVDDGHDGLVRPPVEMEGEAAAVGCREVEAGGAPAWAETGGDGGEQLGEVVRDARVR